MNEVALQFKGLRQDVPLVLSPIATLQQTGANPVFSEDLIHELRQPLGIIDSLAYYLELTATDEKCCTHLQQIRAMVSQVNRILEHASHSQRELPMGASFLSNS